MFFFPVNSKKCRLNIVFFRVGVGAAEGRLPQFERAEAGCAQGVAGPDQGDTEAEQNPRSALGAGEETSGGRRTGAIGPGKTERAESHR